MWSGVGGEQRGVVQWHRGGGGGDRGIVAPPSVQRPHTAADEAGESGDERRKRRSSLEMHEGTRRR